MDRSLTYFNSCIRALTEANASQAQLRQAYHQMMKRSVVTINNY